MSLRSRMASVSDRLIAKYGDEQQFVTIVSTPGATEFDVPTLTETETTVNAVVTGVRQWETSETVTASDLSVLVGGGAVIAVPMVMARRLVMMGQGLTFLPASYVRAPIASGEFVQLNIVDMPKLYSEPVIIAYKNRDVDEAHQAFIDVFKNMWQQLIVK